MKQLDNEINDLGYSQNFFILPPMFGKISSNIFYKMDNKNMYNYRAMITNVHDCQGFLENKHWTKI